MLRQMADFKSGARKDRFWMNPISAALPEEDWQTALRYYATIEPIDWVDVIETDTVPKNYVGKGRMRFVHPDGGTEPLGNRILEFPEDPDLVHLRHPYSGFIAYAPLGSVARGKDLATTGGSGKTITCHICHGEGLKGLGEVPAIAGMSPLYVVRQLNDIKTGARAGISAALMQATVANLTEEDIVALAAYLASLDP
jgi:cytochrome c553